MLKLMLLKEMLADETWSYPNFKIKMNIYERFYRKIQASSIDTLSEECTNYGALSHLTEHSRAKSNCDHYGKVELFSVN